MKTSNNVNFSLHLFLFVTCLILWLLHGTLSAYEYEQGQYYSAALASISATASVWAAKRMWGHMHAYGRACIVELFVADESARQFNLAQDQAFERGLEKSRRHEARAKHRSGKGAA